MEKGKLKNEDRYLSIMLVPHFAGKLKVLKFSTPYSRLIGMVSVSLVSMICMFFFVIYSANQTKSLKSTVAKLSELNIEQKNLISEKSSEIDELKQKNEKSDASIQEYVKKYKEITDEYFTSKTNRSGDRDAKAFIEDMTELKDILNNISQLNVDNSAPSDDLKETEAKLKEYIDSVPTLWPVTGRITSRFGDREDPFWFSSKFHAGVDIAADYGVKIKASASGTVTLSEYKSGYGNCIIIEHGHGISTVYGHSSRLLAKAGQKVSKGDVIALVGSSGRSTGPHLHFEVRINDVVVDPLKYLDSK